MRKRDSDDSLLAWSRSLDYDAYSAAWGELGASLPSEGRMIVNPGTVVGAKDAIVEIHNRSVCGSAVNTHYMLRKGRL